MSGASHTRHPSASGLRLASESLLSCASPRSTFPAHVPQTVPPQEQVARNRRSLHNQRAQAAKKARGAGWKGPCSTA